MGYKYWLHLKMKDMYKWENEWDDGTAFFLFGVEI